MSSYKEKLKASQGNSREFTKLPIVESYQIKEHPDTKEPLFLRWDKEAGEKGEHVYLKGSVEGVMIGNAMRMYAFDDELGKNGGNYFSDYYFNKDEVTLFKPGDKIVKAVKGNLEEVIEWIAGNTTSRMAKKKVCIFLQTLDGLIEVQSNITIFIDQLKTCRRQAQSMDVFLERMMILTPSVWTPESNVTKKAVDILGRFITKNPPKFADMVIGQPVPETWSEKLGEVADLFIKWKKEKMQLGTAITTKVTTDIDEQNGKPEKTAQEKAVVKESQSPPYDDLPF